MGGKSCKATDSGKRTITIVVLGLDNAGKTTTTLALEKQPTDSTTPTVGFSQSEIVHKSERIKLIDLGGAKNFRDAWRHYYADAYGFVYVLDSSEPNRLSENREVFRQLLQEAQVKAKPILILANKQDKEDALDRNQIVVDLHIERLVNESKTLCRVELCAAKSLESDPKKMKVDESIRNGFDWLIKVIFENYDPLHQRVENDVRNRDEIVRKEKLERKARVEKLRQEREKAEGAQKDNDENDDALKAGFVPINQAVKNAERSTKEKTDKSEPNNEKAAYRPVPAPRSSSQTRQIISESTNKEREIPRSYSAELSPRQQLESRASRFDGDDDSINSTEEQPPVRSTVGKKKKLLGPMRRTDGDNLPPPAPSSAASRREDFSMSRGPPVGTPRPSGLVAQWAITSHTPQASTEKLTTIASDNELDVDDDKQKFHRSSKRTVPPHSIPANRIRPDKQISNGNDQDDDNEDRSSNHQRSSSRQKQNSHRDLVEDENVSQRSRPSSVQKSKSRLNDENDDDQQFDYRKRTDDFRERDRSIKQRRDQTYNDKDEEYNDVKNRQVPSSSHRINGSGDISSRSRRNLDDDER